MLTDPPICDRCIDSLDSISKLEQHSSVLKESLDNALPGSSDESIFQPAARTSARRATVQSSVDRQATRQQDASQSPKHVRPLLAWMSLLPSNVNPHVKPPSRTVLSRRISFPSYISSATVTPYMTPLEWPLTHDNYESHHPRTPPEIRLDGDITPKTSEQRKRASIADLASLLVQSQDLIVSETADQQLAEELPSKEFVSKCPNLPSSICGPIRQFLRPLMGDNPSRKICGTTPLLDTPTPNQPPDSQIPSLSSKDSVSKSPPTNPQIPTPQPSSPPPRRSPFPRRTSTRQPIPLSTPPASPPKGDQQLLKKTPNQPTTAHINETIAATHQLTPPLSPSPSPKAKHQESESVSPKPPFLTELSSFFESRNGPSANGGRERKLILPSRALEGKVRGNRFVVGDGRTRTRTRD